MRPIYYKHIPNGDCFKFTFDDNIEMKHIDACLDVVGAKDNVFIDESEFESKYEKTMDIDVMDNTHTIKLGVLTTQWLDMDNYDEGDTL